jgi:hypothetical protein
MISKYFWKLLLIGIFTVPLLLFFTNASLTEVLLATLGLSIVTYLAGDQIILRLTNNAIATLADIGLTFVYLWFVANLLGWALSFTQMAIISLVVGAIEYFIHGYFQKDKGRIGRKSFNDN